MSWNECEPTFEATPHAGAHDNLSAKRLRRSQPVHDEQGAFRLFPIPRQPFDQAVETFPRARRSLGRGEGTCNRQSLKPFVVDPVGPNPTRQGLATHRKRVLRGTSESSSHEA